MSKNQFSGLVLGCLGVVASISFGCSKLTRSEGITIAPEPRQLAAAPMPAPNGDAAPQGSAHAMLAKPKTLGAAAAPARAPQPQGACGE